MKLLSYCCLFFLALTISATAQTPIPYGDNPAVGKFIVLNKVKHYYEVYGEGRPLLLIHGNGTGIKGWAAQIADFSKKYKVYAIDCRGRGKSDLGKDTLSYKQQAGDMAAFIQEMKMDQVYVVGKSDGGIIALMMGISHPQHIAKIVSFSANVEPDTTALYPKAVQDVKDIRRKADKMLAAKDKSEDWELIRQKNRMMEFQPHISAAELAKIKVPVLVISTDRDVIKEEHTLFIYKSIPKANLCILPGETHHVPKQHPQVFNEAVDRFLSAVFKGNEYRFNN